MLTAASVHSGPSSSAESASFTQCGQGSADSHCPSVVSASQHSTRPTTRRAASLRLPGAIAQDGRDDR